MDAAFLRYRLAREGIRLSSVGDRFGATSVSRFALYREGVRMEPGCVYVAEGDVDAAVPDGSLLLVSGRRAVCPKSKSAALVGPDVSFAALVNALACAFGDYGEAVSLARSRKADLGHIVQAIGKLFMLPCTLIGRSFTALASAGFEEFEMLEDPEEQRTIRQEIVWDEAFHETQGIEGAFLYENTMIGADTVPMLCYNIVAKGRYRARLALMLSDAGDAELLSGCIESIGAELDDCFGERDLEDRYGHRSPRFEAAMQAIADGNDTADPHAISRAGWALDQAYQVYAMHFDTRFPLVVGGEYLRDQLELFLGECFVTDNGRCFVCVVRLGERPASEQESLRKLVPFLREYIGHAGISNRYGNLLQTPRYVRQAEIALSFGEERAPTLWYHRFSDYAYEYLLRTATAEFPVDELIAPELIVLRRRDDEKESELLHTLETYVRLKCNGKAASDALFIHRTTFQYRMKLIEELTGLDVQDEAAYARLLASFELLRIADEARTA